MANPRIIHIALDEATILWRSADIEQERRIAIFDLIEENTFKPCRAWDAGHQGPYRLGLAVEDGRLTLEVSDEDGSLLEQLVLGLGRRPRHSAIVAADLNPLHRIGRTRGPPVVQGPPAPTRRNQAEQQRSADQAQPAAAGFSANHDWTLCFPQPLICSTQIRVNNRRAVAWSVSTLPSSRSSSISAASL